MLLEIILLVASLALLFFGAEFSLEGSEKVGLKLGLSPLAIGMLLVGFGTSLPEFFVGHIAAVKGEMGIALGTLVGSNIANMFLILGICGFYTTLTITHKSLQQQLLIHLALGIILYFIIQQGHLNVYIASPLIGLCGLYLYLLYRDLRKNPEPASKERIKNMPLLMIKMLAGFGMLYLGGELLVKAGTDLCDRFGVEAYIVSAIFIAFGTSFPELVTSLLACYKQKDTDLILGNIIGSNLFNCAFILGSLGIYDFTIAVPLKIEVYALIAGALYLVLNSYTKKTFFRFSALSFLAAYSYMVGHWMKVF